MIEFKKQLKENVAFHYIKYTSAEEVKDCNSRNSIQSRDKHRSGEVESTQAGEWAQDS